MRTIRYCITACVINVFIDYKKLCIYFWTTTNLLMINVNTISLNNYSTSFLYDQRSLKVPFLLFHFEESKNRFRACVRACVHACVRACVHVSVHPSVHPSLRPSIRPFVLSFLCCHYSEYIECILRWEEKKEPSIAMREWNTLSSSEWHQKYIYPSQIQQVSISVLG